MHKLNDALERIYRDQRQRLFTCALAITRSRERAEDAIQEAFCKLFQLAERPRHLKAYVYRTVHNAAIDQVRRGPPAAQELNEFIFDRGAGPREAAAESEFQQRVADGLLSLSENERDVIIEHVYGELTFREISQVREAAVGTVVSWYRRGMKRLRARLEDES